MALVVASLPGSADTIQVGEFNVSFSIDEPYFSTGEDPVGDLITAQKLGIRTSSDDLAIAVFSTEYPIEFDEWIENYRENNPLGIHQDIEFRGSPAHVAVKVGLISAMFPIDLAEDGTVTTAYTVQGTCDIFEFVHFAENVTVVLAE